MTFTQHLTLCIACMLPLPALAQSAPPPPQAMQAQLRTWIADRLGPHAAAELRIRVRPEEDHVRLAVAAPAVTGDAEATAVLRPRGDGRWAADAIRIPAAIFALPGPSGSTEVSFNVGAQDSRAVIDPGLAAPSSLDLDLRDIGLTANGPGLHQAEHIGQVDLHARLTPRGDRLDFDQETMLRLWRSTSRLHGRSVAAAADSVQGSGHLGGLDHRRAEALLAAVAGLLATLPANLAAAQHGAPLPAPGRAAVLAWAGALRDGLTDAHGAETVSGLNIAVAGQGEAHVRQVRLAADFSAPDGMLHGWFDIGIDGLQISGLPQDQAALVPTRVVMHPTVTGVRLADLTALMLEATEPGTGDRLRNDAATLLLRRGVTLGMESMTMNLGPAMLSGHGHVSLDARDEYQLDAHFTATGFDTLMAQAAADPALHRSLPVLAIMRGFARPQGDRLVWDVEDHGGRLTVNGIPLSAGDQPDRR